MYLITVLLPIIFTIALLEDTHVKVYKNYGSEMIDEYDISLDLPGIFLIFLVGLIPIMNIIVFIIFIISYIIHTTYDYQYIEEECHVFSLRGKNWITKGILGIKKKILN